MVWLLAFIIALACWVYCVLGDVVIDLGSGKYDQDRMRWVLEGMRFVVMTIAICVVGALLAWLTISAKLPELRPAAGKSPRLPDSRPVIAERVQT